MDKETAAEKGRVKALAMNAVGDPSIKRTNIDRRQCKRIVPMEVLSLGASRCGGSSIRKALLYLGYHDVYHFSSLMDENPRDCEMWEQAFDAVYGGKGSFGKEEWDQLLGHCMALTDSPCVSFAPQLVEAYPNAKVILATRDSDDQYFKSYFDTIYKWTVENYPPYPTVLQRIWGWLLPAFPLDGLMHRMIRAQHMYDFPWTGIADYRKHNALVRQIVPKHNLLEYNVKQGWGPLCEFLGKPLPDIPFPRVNDTDEFIQNNFVAFRKYKRFLVANALLRIARKVAALVGSAYLVRLILLRVTG
ncbi:hypothetical protein V1509DRAFT_635685 [Lipomyces kononenkoae]